MNRILIFILFFLTLVSCKKEAFKFKFTEKKKLNVSELDFEYFHGKSRFSYDDGFQSVNASANIRIKKDSVIWVSVSPAIGIEAFRAMVRKDSAFIIDRINKTYETYSIDSLQNKLNVPISFDVLQAVLIGNLIEERKSEDRVIKSDDFFILKQNSEDLVIHNYVNNKTMKIEKVAIEKNAGINSLEIAYNDFQFVDNWLFPYENKLRVYSNREKTSVSKEMIIAFNRISVDDKNMRFPFSVPNKYLANE